MAAQVRRPQQQHRRKVTKEITDRAEKCMKDRKYEEAFFHWTHAIKANPDDADLYHQRCRCFLASGQYYYALQDAEALVRICPKSILGYQLRSEVYQATKNYGMAAEMQRECFLLSAGRELKQKHMEMINKFRALDAKQRALEARYPYVGAAVGVAVGAAVVVVDFVVNGQHSYVAHPVLKVLAVLLASAVFSLVAKIFQTYGTQSRATLLQAPPDLLDEAQSLHHRSE